MRLRCTFTASTVSVAYIPRKVAIDPIDGGT
jgi:hypothetical protein